MTLTGGEPLVHPDVNSLICSLIREGFEVNVETNGSIVPKLKSDKGNLFYTMDMKTPSSGMCDHMSMEAYEQLTSNDVLKFVVGDTTDMDVAKHLLTLRPTQAEVYFSPVFGKIEPREIVEYLQEFKMYPCKVQLQLHKYIWDPMKRGV